jgi:hypothetical protein
LVRLYSENTHHNIQLSSEHIELQGNLGKMPKRAKINFCIILTVINEIYFPYFDLLLKSGKNKQENMLPQSLIFYYCIKHKVF